MATYACTDLHGCYSLWTKIRDYCKPDDIIYFLGDAADRGEDGIKIIQELLKDPRVIYLEGNHEAMIKLFFNNPTKENLEFWSKNGGDPTQRNMLKLPEDEFSKIINEIKNLPLWAKYLNPYTSQVIYLSHSGFYCEQDTFNSDPKKYTVQLLENRDPNAGAALPPTIDYIIHGHTPVQYYWDDNKEHKLEPLFYNKYKIDLDICSIITNKVILFNLDDFTYKIFTGEENK